MKNQIFFPFGHLYNLIVSLNCMEFSGYFLSKLFTLHIFWFLVLVQIIFRNFRPIPHQMGLVVLKWGVGEVKGG